MQRESAASENGAAKGPGFGLPVLSVPEQLRRLKLEDDISGMPLGQVVGLVRMAVAEAHVNATESEVRDEAERRHAEVQAAYDRDEAPIEPAAEDRADLDDLMHGSQESDYPTESDVPCDECGGVVMLNSAEEDRRLASRVADGVAIEVLCDSCAAAEQPVERRADPLEPIADRLGDLCAAQHFTAEMSLHMITERVRDAALALPDHFELTEADIVAEAERIWESFSDNRKGPRVADVNPDGTLRDWRRPENTPDRGEGVGETHHTVTDDEPRFSGAGAHMTDGPTSRLIPSDAEFQKRQYIDAPALSNLADVLIERHGFLEQLEECRIDFKWQRTGTNWKGKRSIGKLKRVSGEFVDYCPAQFIVSLAADTARLAGFTDRQVEAALFHQLLHIDRDKKGNWIRVGHDFEGFGTEVRHYGPWTEDLKIGGQAFTAAHQMGLFDQAGTCDDDEDTDEDDDGAGVLIHADGTPMTAEEIAEMEAAELADDDDVDEDDDPSIGMEGEPDILTDDPI